MRTRDLKIDGQKREAILVAGGPKFKIYTASGLDGWVVASGKKVFVVEESSPDFKVVGRYVNLRFQSPAEQLAIKEGFDSFLKSRTDASSEPVARSVPDSDSLS